MCCASRRTRGQRQIRTLGREMAPPIGPAIIEPLRERPLHIQELRSEQAFRTSLVWANPDPAPG